MKYLLIFLSSSCFAQLSGSINTTYATQALYGFDVRYKVKEGIQQVHYIAAYATNANADLISLSAGGRHGAKLYWGAQFTVSAYRFKNDFNQTIVSLDPIIGYRFKKVFIEAGTRIGLQKFGVKNADVFMPVFLTIGF